MDAKNLADLYDLPTLEWAPIAARLEEGVTMAPGTGGPDRHSCWLATINADGSPHVNGVGPSGSTTRAPPSPPSSAPRPPVPRPGASTRSP